MGNIVDIESVLPIWKVSENAIISKMGDYTIGFKVTLPEIFTNSNDDYEGFHQALIKAIRTLPKFTVFHKQDWFIEEKYQAIFERPEKNEGEDLPLGHDYLTKSSERFFNERPYLHHSCYLYLTKKPEHRQISSSIFSTLARKNIVPQDVLDINIQREFFDSVGQFVRILTDSGFIQLEQLTTDVILSKNDQAGVLEKYLFLQTDAAFPEIKQVQIKPDIRIGKDYCTIFSLGDAINLPPACGSRLTY